MAKKKHKKHSRLTFSHLLALIITVMAKVVDVGVLFIAHECVVNGYIGELMFLTTMLGANEASLAYILKKYFDKSQAENTVGGIVYDSALGHIGNKGTDEI